MISTTNKKSVRWYIISILTILIIAILSMQIGCTVNGGKTTLSATEGQGTNTDSTNKTKDNKKNNISEDFNSLVSKEDGINKIAEFIIDNIPSVSKEDASLMVIKFEEIQKNYLSKIEDKYYNGNTIQEKMMKVYKPGFDINKIDDVIDTELKSLLIETRDGGYKVETAEGTFFPLINYEFYKRFSSYLTADIKEYIDILAVESNNVPAKDAALTISWDEVLKRALSQEAFLNKYASSTKADDMKNLYKKYVTFTLYGLNNTPLFDYEKKQMIPQAKAAFTNAAGSSSSGYTKMIKDYLEVLKMSNYKLTDEVEKFRKSYGL